MSIRISVLTPVWNRAEMLPRVFDSLNKQTYQNFEWLVGNDGSSDGFQSIFKQLVDRSRFPITLIDADIRVGKAKIDNHLVHESSGDLILWCDSDDILVPSALQEIVDGWMSIPENTLNKFVGVTAICSANEIEPFSYEIPENNFYPSWNDLSVEYQITQDMLFVAKASALKDNPFPEVDYVIPEGVIWSRIGNKKTIFINKILQEKEYGAKNAISFNKKMQFCRGYAYALAERYRNLKKYQFSLIHQLKSAINFLRLSIHGDIAFSQVLKLWKGNTSLPFLLLMIPGAMVLVLKDTLLGKVVKTHIDFEKNIQTSKIHVHKY